MRRIISVTIASVILMISGKLYAQTVITNPLQHFKAESDLEGVAKIYKLEVDINHDGLKEIFLSTGKSDPPDVDEFAWDLYIASPDGKYILASEKTDTGINQNIGVGFKKDQYWVGFIPELSKYGLLYLACGRGGHAMCQLKAIVLERDTFKIVEIGQPVLAETNYIRLAGRFTTSPAPPVQELSVQ